jgi:Holliday junction resolvasome RuvABC endonuclease subunit
MIYIGIDNGVTGTIGVIDTKKELTDFIQVPVITEQSYTKKKQNITRIDHEKLKKFLGNVTGPNVRAMMERPMINNERFVQTLSAARSLESVLILVEFFRMKFSYVDSKKWQNLLLPTGCKGTALKKASADISCRLFPEHKELIRKHKDGDGLLIAEYCRRFYS